jgi:CxxC motif-containing protein (DUF1111 family)
VQKKTLIFFSIIAFIAAMHACRKPEPFPDEELDERMSGGDATVFDEGGGAFGHAIPGMSLRDEVVHSQGDKLFEIPFVTAPAPLYAGLGPVYNSRNCVSCHIADGRGKPPVNGEMMQSMLFKLSTGQLDEHGAPVGVPGFGGQLQDKAIAGVRPEGSVQINYTFSTVKLSDGSEVQLRKPTYTIVNTYLPLPGGTQFSPRVANPVVGLGLLECIEESSILSHADANDLDEDGISGRPNYVYDYMHGKSRVLGRFGWKATSVDVKTQTAKALNQDMGITTSLFPKKSSYGQEQMSAAHMQQPYDLHDTLWQAVSFYTKTLAVPARRNVHDPVVKAGQAIFRNINCVKCHVDVHITKTDVAFAPLSGQVIRPYTDLLLHDMGDELADGFSEFDANGNEWRTPALWGLGLTQKVSGHTYLLHDGRARNITEAILWHGGEAESSKQKFIWLTTAERNALLKFLATL